MGNELITKKQRNLLINSTVIQNKSFEDLYIYLIDNEYLSKPNNILFPNLNSYFDSLIQESQAEWVPVNLQDGGYKDLGEDYKKSDRITECDLCGKKGIRYLYKIRNKKNNKRLIVGSECIKEFSEYVILRFKDIKNAARKKDLEESFKGINDFIENGYKYINELVVFPTLSLERKWKTLYNDIHGEYNKLFKEPNKSTEVLEDLWNKKIKLKKDIELLVEKRKGKLYYGNQSIIKWLIKNSPETLRQIKEDDGKITWKTIHKIYEPSFMEEIINILRKKHNTVDITIIGLKKGTRKVEYILNCPFNLKVLLEISFKDLMLNCGGVLFEKESEINISDIKLESSISNIHEKRKLIEWILNKLRNEFKIRYFDIQENELFVEDFNTSDVILKIKPNDVIMSFHKYLFDGIKNLNDLENALLNNIVKKLSYKEYERDMDAKTEAKKLYYSNKLM